MTGLSHAQDARRIVTTENADFFGFDLRSEQNVSLDECSSACLGDSACRAFTYNNKAKWCFLKSDFNQMKPFAGATAGKVVTLSGDADIGAPPALTYVPDWIKSQAEQYRRTLTGPHVQKPEEGLGALVEDAAAAAQRGDQRGAVLKYEAALSALPRGGQALARTRPCQSRRSARTTVARPPRCAPMPLRPPSMPMICRAPPRSAPTTLANLGSRA
ncbi:PAN domain-containing protein [Aquamicrobium lusatiense]|nr:PAN/Apple domain-containing protein [Aquamicrobium lusatiense]MDH4990624.1 PAN domain-containing protein [Aquamicrobium lusatiense]